MWRNVSWNSTDSSLPDGMHKHEPGPYFRTPSKPQGSSGSDGRPDSAHGSEPRLQVGSLPPAFEAEEQTATVEEIESGQVISSVPPPPPESPQSPFLDESDNNNNTNANNNSASNNNNNSNNNGYAEGVVGQRQVASKRVADKKAQEGPKRTRFKETSSTFGTTSSSSQPQHQAGDTLLYVPKQNQPPSGHPPPQQQQQQHQQQQGFRSRLSSISGALQHPRLTRRLFSGGSGGSGAPLTLEQQHLQQQQQQQQQNDTKTVQITTTSIDSPKHQLASPRAGDPNGSGLASGSGNTGPKHEDAEGHTLPGSQSSAHPRHSSSGRRLSQLFLPQQLMLSGQHPILLNQLQDPYAANELIPAHLLGLYGQPPLVGTIVGGPGPGGGCSGGGPGASLGAGVQRASWADISLLGRLANVRPSIDSAFASSGGLGGLTSQLARHSFDARK